jgi:hypothetical protein
MVLTVGLIVLLVALGLIVLLAGTLRTAGRGCDSRREIARFQREMSFINHDRDTRLELLEHVDAAAAPPVLPDRVAGSAISHSAKESTWPPTQPF